MFVFGPMRQYIYTGPDEDIHTPRMSNMYIMTVIVKRDLFSFLFFFFFESVSISPSIEWSQDTWLNKEILRVVPIAHRDYSDNNTPTPCIHINNAGKPLSSRLCSRFSDYARLSVVVSFPDSIATVYRGNRGIPRSTRCRLRSCGTRSDMS
jgi:hypothetical protein